MKVNKEVFADFVEKLDAGVDAVTEDGAGVEDMDEGLAIALAIPGLVAEIKKDKVSGLLALAEAAAGHVVDERNAASTE